MIINIGIYNGNFGQGLEGWGISGDVSTTYKYNYYTYEYMTCAYLYAHYGPATLEQTFIIDKCILKFDWISTGPTNGYELHIDGLQVISKILTAGGGSETIDTSAYIDHTARILFLCHSDRLYIGNIAESVDAYSISVASYPPGADIHLDNIPTGQITGDIPVIVHILTGGTYTITLKLTGYQDYVETVDVVSCVTSYISGVFERCATFITNPPGAKICIDNVDTHETTPKTFCGYDIGSDHTYSLYLKNYRVETGTITFISDKGNLIDKTLIYETGGAKFNITPNGSKIIIDGIDTGKITPEIVDNIPIGYHSYEILLDGYYSLTGSFRSIVNTIKQTTGTLQQITGVTNGTFDTDLSGWIVTTPDSNYGNVEWQEGRAHLYGHDISSGLAIYQDIDIIEDRLVFDYSINNLRYTNDAGWNITIDPDTPSATIVASWNSSAAWQNERFEIDVSAYKGNTVRLLIYLNCRRRFSEYSNAWVDNVGNIPKPTRSVTFDTYCSTLAECPASSLSMTRCYADLYLDDNRIETDHITLENLSIGSHSYRVTNRGYVNIDTSTEDVTGNISFSKGVQTHIYVDNIFLSPVIPIAEGCTYIESDPPGASILIDNVDSGKITPDTICDISLGDHSYKLKLLNHTVYNGTFTLGPQFGEYISVIITGSVYFTSVPSGARIYIDDNDSGLYTPQLVQGIKAGHHQYTLVRPYYNNYTNTIYVIGEP